MMNVISGTWKATLTQSSFTSKSNQGLDSTQYLHQNGILQHI